MTASARNSTEKARSGRQKRARVLLGLTCLLLFCASLPAQTIRPTVRYDLLLPHPSDHLFHVNMFIFEVRGEVLVQMPAWNALYQIRDFSSRVQEVSAEADGRAIAVEKLDKQTWRLRAQGTVTVHYAVFWDSPGPFASQLNEEHAFINPAMVFLYVPDRRSEGLQVDFRQVPAGWRVESPIGVGDSQAGAYSMLAPSYDALADSPIEMGPFKSFRIGGLVPPVEVLVHGDNWKQADVEDALRKICRSEIALMGGAPFRRYLFLLHVGKAAQGAGGGMEHADGTAINISSGQMLPGVAAHEFFHLWNVKRIRPASLEPIDYTREQYTRALWFAEGVTSTYGNYALVRSGLWSREAFYSDLAERIGELESRPANRWQSAEQSSLDAWLEKYPYYNAPEFSVSYYSKGQVLGVLLDILIRDRTRNARSLDDVLRRMDLEFARKGRFYRDSLDVRLAAEEVAGGSLEEFFRSYVAGAGALPYAAILAKGGLVLAKQEIRRADTGFLEERDASGRVMVRSVTPGSAADQAGLRPGDEIRAWNGEPFPRRLESWLRDRRPGERLRLEIVRGGQPAQLSLALDETTESVFQVTEDPHAAPAAKAIREGLLHGTPASAAAASR